MGASKQCVDFDRLKREDCEHTKHGSDFSGWKVLIRPSDWEDHSLGKEGAERYRVHNLPNCSSCSGIYELGIAVPCTRSERETSKLYPDHIIPVYLGQTDNVKTRLQCYGREGAHLENGNTFGQLNDSVKQGHGLFSEIFSEGYSIAYRWAPMKSKRDAEKTEAWLLDKFDYAWNKGNNGIRRHNDILQKLDRSTSSNTQLLAISKKLQNFHQNDTCKPLMFENGSYIYTNQESNDFLSRILKIGKSQPRLVSQSFGFNKGHTHICGVALSHGSICRRPPVEGRKRCAEHKGMKINGFTSKLITEGKSLDDVSVESSIVFGDPECDGHRTPSSSHYTVKPRLSADNFPLSKGSFPICGITLDDGILCRRQPVQGRKRCEEHKGRKIKGSSLSESVTEGKQHYVHGPVLDSSTYAKDYEQVSSKALKSHRPQSPVFSERSVINKKLDTICGVDLEDGTFCTRQPVIGRKRCEEHKWKKVTGSKSKLPVADLPSVVVGSGISSCSGQKYDKDSCLSVSHRSVVNKGFSSTCGATLADGSSCSRPPAEGRKRCWQHKGMKETSGSSYNFTSIYGGSSSDICGASLQNGSICYRMPVHGRKRCEQHKGMRASSGSSYDFTASSGSSYDFTSMYGGISLDICGAALWNGSICYRMPVHGRKRCEQHKGMRAAF